MAGSKPRATVAATALAALAGAATLLGQQSPLDYGLIITEQSRPSFAVIGAGARAAGMGGAFTALADDASAASFNPAGLALLIKPEVSMVLSGRHVEQKDERVFGLDPAARVMYSDTTVSYDSADLRFAAFTVPLELWSRNLCLQLSYHRLVDFNQESDRSYEGTTASGVTNAVHQTIEQSGDIHTFTLATAYQVTERMSLGIALHRWLGEWEFSSYSDLHTSPGGEEPYFAYAQRTGLEGWSWSLGVLLRYPVLNVGLNYRPPFDATISADAHVDSSFIAGSDAPREGVPLHWPTSWTAGLALKPTETWRITLDYARYNWSEMEIRDIEMTDEAGATRLGAINFFDLRPSSETTTEDAGDWRLGTELTLFAGRTPVQLRAGAFRDEQPQRMLSVDAHPEPIVGYTAGAGVRLGAFAVDLAYQYTTGQSTFLQFVDPRVLATEDPSPAQFAVSTRTVTEHRVFLSFLYQFSREATDRALHYLFVGPGED